MGIGILSEVQNIGGPCGRDSAAQGNDPTRTDRFHGMRAQGSAAQARMRLLHFENAFGEAHASEYCLDAMLSLVVLMVRNARPDADKLARLTGAASAAYPAERGVSPGGAAVGEDRAGSARAASCMQ